LTTRIAAFSDLHGNSAATAAVLAAIDAEAPDAIYNLGDLVGYGAKPNETIALIRERGIPTIMGNYSNRSSGPAASPPRRTRPTCARCCPRSVSRRKENASASCTARRGG
jgi:3',5'-cyclic AMP phosphodiesterase CpdA